MPTKTHTLFPYNKISKETFLTEVFVGEEGICLHGDKSTYWKLYMLEDLKNIDSALETKKYIDIIRELIKNKIN